MLVKPQALSLEMAMALLLLALGVIQAAADDIVGCGGFVEASPALAKLRKTSDPKLDYSHITIKLLTLEGLVKDKTQCAPNGYYFLPVYEKGSFLITVQGPSGWSFTPSQVPVLVDQQGCNGNEDINFHYTGFSLSGRVLGNAGSSCKAVGDGPSGVEILLFGPGDSTNKQQSTTTSGGDYKFDNLVIGTYRIEASHPTLDINLSGSNEVHVGWGNGVVNNIFSVPGYSVEGSVLSKGIPVLGVQIFLHSSDVKELQCPQGPGRSPLPDSALCHATSDAEGKFRFTNVPCGDYTLVPFYKGENTVFGVSPAALGISVGHESLVVEEGFQVTGFSIGGKVVDSEGVGIGKVKILLDNVERAVTDASGTYKLDQVTSTRYTITAHKEHYRFTTLKDFMVLPNMAAIPSIEATHYDLCGSVRVVGQYGKRQVALTHGPSNVKPQTKRVDDSDKFCFEVPPGEYRVSPMATVAEQGAGLLFSPPFLDIAVSAPVLDAAFLQAKVSLAGHLRCKGDCSTGISVSLVHTQSQESRKLITSEEFEFKDVFPGKYKLEVNKEGHNSVDDEWCWEQKTLDVQVHTSDIRDLVFVQKGYWLRIEATHAARAFISQETRDSTPLQINKGRQQVCIETPGVHILQFLWPCVFFGAHSFSFDTSKPKILQLTGEKYVLNGHIDVYSPDANSLGEKLLVDVWDKNDGKLIEANISARLVSEANETSPIAVYAYDHWAPLGDELVIVPRYVSLEDQTEQVLLFYPSEQYVHVASDGCQPEVPRFAARPGVYVTGSVVPALAGVEVTVIAEKGSKTGKLQAGSVAMSVVTGDDGVFVAGPLYDDAQYIVRAEKPGYHFKPFGKNSFECQRLSQIVVNIVSGEGAEEILPAVLLSLSGDDGYRKNAVALPGGTFAFDNMFPGSFYLRPLLKEYSFSPAAQALELGSGETLNATFTARRTGYSIFGTVTSLSGKAEEGISLEARSESGGYYEETTTDADGKYRLRGLSPDTTYNVQVVIKEESPRLERASPSVYQLKISNSDTRSVDFVVFEHSPSAIITGVVEGHDLQRWQAHITVELATISEPGRVVKEVPLPLSCHFEIQDVARGKYILRLVSRQSLQSHKFHSDTLEVDLTKNSYVHLAESLRFAAEEAQLKQDLTPPPLVPVLVAVSVLSLFAAVPSLKEKFTASSGGQMREMRKTSQRKRI